MLIGARQVGKSTLFKQIIESKDNVLNLNCDDPTVRTILQDINLNTLKRLIGNNKIVVI
ncbi:MAG: AAA family ATPase, partial [Bacteroidales bacterium]|nr:AAA family ATPase [Bacteroidales bacterium]